MHRTGGRLSSLPKWPIFLTVLLPHTVGWIFTVVFGGILPTVSFLLAKVLSDVVDEDDDEQPNERTARTNGEQFKNDNEQVFETGKKQQIFAFLDEHPEMDGKVTEVAGLLQAAKRYVSQTTKEWRAMQVGGGEGKLS